MASTRKTKHRLRVACRAAICLAVLALGVSAYVVTFWGGRGGKTLRGPGIMRQIKIPWKESFQGIFVYGAGGITPPGSGSAR